MPRPPHPSRTSATAALLISTGPAASKLSCVNTSRRSWGITAHRSGGRPIDLTPSVAWKADVPSGTWIHDPSAVPDHAGDFTVIPRSRPSVPENSISPLTSVNTTGTWSITISKVLGCITPCTSPASLPGAAVIPSLRSMSYSPFADDLVKKSLSDLGPNSRSRASREPRVQVPIHQRHQHRPARRWLPVGPDGAVGLDAPGLFTLEHEPPVDPLRRDDRRRRPGRGRHRHRPGRVLNTNPSAQRRQLKALGLARPHHRRRLSPRPAAASPRPSRSPFQRAQTSPAAPPGSSRPRA